MFSGVKAGVPALCCCWIPAPLLGPGPDPTAPPAGVEVPLGRTGGNEGLKLSSCSLAISVLEETSWLRMS